MEGVGQAAKRQERAARPEREDSLPVLRAEQFSLSFRVGKVWYPAVNRISLTVAPGEMTALIGESGCGKSMTALSVMGLQPEEARLEGGLFFQGQNLLELTPAQWTEYRGNRISMIFQEPMTALNPLVRVGKQILENVLEHQRVSRGEGKRQVLAMMRQVGLPDVEELYETYPHLLSGGQRQRIMIAMAFINDPDLLIADEPTTALDVTIQAQILELMRKMNREKKSAVLLISHNLGVVKRLCRRVYLMYAGQIVETGTVEEILNRPLHPYTKGLVAAIPGAGKRGQELASIPGTVPALDARPAQGCVFCGRCDRKTEKCGREMPPMREYGGRQVLCHRTAEELLGAAEAFGSRTAAGIVGSRSAAEAFGRCSTAEAFGSHGAEKVFGSCGITGSEETECRKH